MAKIKKLLALGLCLCMAAGITVGCGDSKSSNNGTDSGKNTMMDYRLHFVLIP